jgi:hypothetical protein
MVIYYAQTLAGVYVDSGDTSETLQTAELAGRLVMNACMQPGERLQAHRYDVRILSHALGKRSLPYTVEYDTLAPADFEHASDRRNRNRHRLYRRVDRRLAECRGFFAEER